MSNLNLTKATKTIRLKPDGSGYTVVAGAADVTSDEVDTQGYDAVRFIQGFGAITSGAATSMKAQQDTVTGMGSAADIEGSLITVADTHDNKIAIIDIIRPRERFVRVKTLRATQNSVIDFLIAELYRASTEPVTQDTTVLSAETSASPAEGTA